MLKGVKASGWTIVALIYVATLFLLMIINLTVTQLFSISLNKVWLLSFFNASWVLGN